MQILSVSLTNFKIHQDSYFEFQPGVNTICGENGAGKTSILQAIAWVLFNYDSGLSKEDLIRKGAKSAQVRVEMVSPRDHRTYRISRCTSQGYEIYDPQISKKLQQKAVKEVMGWLKEQLQTTLETDLSKLFAETIGIPQGTFTTDFLKPIAERRQVFDPILKVEEYKQAFKESAVLETYAKFQVQAAEQRVAQIEAGLQDWDELKQQRSDYAQAIQQDQLQLAQLEGALATLKREWEQLRQEANQIQQRSIELRELSGRIQGLEQLQSQQQILLEQARSAAQICQQSLSGYQSYQVAEIALQQLHQSSQTRQNLLQQQQQQRENLTQINIQLAQLETRCQAFAQARQDLDRLQPAVAQQVELEQQLQSLDQQLQQLGGSKADFQQTQKRFQGLKTQDLQLTETITRIQGLKPLVAQLPELEAQARRYQEQLARIGAAQQFETDLQQILEQGNQRQTDYESQLQVAEQILVNLQKTLPQPSTAIATLTNILTAAPCLSQQLLQQIEQILQDLSTQVNEKQLRQQLKTVNQQIQERQRQQLEFQQLAQHQAQQHQVQTDLQELEARLLELQTQLTTEPQLQQQREQLTTKLQRLNNPRGQIQLLERQLQQEPQILAQVDRIQQQKATIIDQITDLDRQLTDFADLDRQLAEQNQLRETYHTDYRQYIQHQQMAQQLDSRQQEYQQTTQELQELLHQQAALQKTYEQQINQHDTERLQAIEQSYYAASAEQNQLLGSQAGKRKQLEQLDRALQQRQNLADQLLLAQQNLKQQRSLQEFVAYARQVYNQTGPRVTRFYLEEISREADRLFRELMNRQHLALRWTEDYEIQVQEGGFWRGLKMMSGGEQMCAAIAVRLSLLRVFANTDIAFFDEPTMNMDRPRRKQLADALSNLRTFRQLFVISHDDTFEEVTESIVRVDRD